MYRLPERAMATPLGKLNAALRAGPPSPAKPSEPLPATVVMTPVAAETLRTELFPESAM